MIVAWAALGPVFGFSDTWQLNELVAAVKGASNRVVDIEALSEGELRTLEQHYAELARLGREDADPTKSHSVEEARRRHTAKRSRLNDT